MVLDVTQISYILQCYNPRPSNWLPLLVDVQERHGFSLRLACFSGMRLLCVIPNEPSRKWNQDNWLTSLTRLKWMSFEKV